MKSNVSLSDIAKALKVSKTLVSLVMNNKGDQQGISKATQKRVMKYAKEVNYKPNLLARSLRTGASHTIGLVVSDIANPFYSRMARLIEDKLFAENYHLMICSTDENTKKEKNIIGLMRDKQFDGIIVSSSQNMSGDFKQLLNEEFPFVMIDRKLPDLKTNFVGIDNYDSTYKAMRHLVRAGYKKIAAFAVSPIYISSISDRCEGYVAAMTKSGMPNPSNLLIEIPFESIKQTVKNEIVRLTQPKDKIDAIFAINNKIAVACLEVFNELNIRIPKDVAFVAFDDIDAFRLTSPRITAIDQPLEEICNNAVSILLDEIKAYKKVKKQVILKPNLILRESV